MNGEVAAKRTAVSTGFVCGLFVVLMAMSIFAGTANGAPRDNDVGFAVLRLLAEKNPASNVVISPFSQQAALELLSAGAAGETQREIQAAVDKSAVRTADGPAPTSLQPSSTSSFLAFGSCLWSPPGIRFSDEFAREAKQDFAAQIFTSEAAAAPALLNEWIKQTTRGLIPAILDQPPDPSGIVIANGIIFLGKWMIPFDPALTAVAAFHGAAGPARNVPMMTRAGHFRYASLPNGQLIDLPYEGGQYSFRIFLPNEPQRLEAWLATATARSWSALASDLQDAAGELFMPRVELSFSSELKPELETVGIRAAFRAGSAEFTPMTADKTPMFVSSFFHRAVVKIDEAGTKAAASTTIRAPGGAPPRSFRMLVNHPFVFAIHGSSENELLFLGVVRAL